MTDELNLPPVDLTDPAQLAAMWGNYGMWDHWRKVVLANCYEIVRAKYAVEKQSVTEARLKELARLHPNYLEFLTHGLEGRILYEREVRQSSRQI